VGQAKVPYPELNSTDLTMRGDHNFALGLSTKRAENFQGYHGEQILIIADEAPGIESGIWDAVAGTMARGKVHLIMAGNPTDRILRRLQQRKSLLELHYHRCLCLPESEWSYP
jgi:hypothetical protein